MNECEGGNEHESDMMRRKYKTFGRVSKDKYGAHLQGSCALATTMCFSNPEQK